jgi:hypothetical protein
MVVVVTGFPIITEWCQLPPTLNITPNFTKIILVASGRVYKDFNGKVLAEDDLPVATLKHIEIMSITKSVLL